MIFNTFLLLIACVTASSDFTDHAFGLGTTQAKTISFAENQSPKALTVFSTQGSYLQSSDDIVLETYVKNTSPRIVTSKFALYYGRVDWVAKVAAGPVATSFKLSAAYSGTQLIVNGQKPTEIIGGYNGTHTDRDIVGIYKDLSLDFHKYSIEWTSDKLTWLVDDQIYKVTFKDSLTNPIDIANWPTTPETVNFMIEPIASSGYEGQKFRTYLKSVTVQDASGGSCYLSSNGNSAATTLTGSKFTVTGNKKVNYPDYLSDWLKKNGGPNLKKRNENSTATANGTTQTPFTSSLLVLAAAFTFLLSF